MKRDQCKILQIIPAPHWWGTFIDKESNAIYYKRASCWALILLKENLPNGCPFEDTDIALMDVDANGVIEEMCSQANFQEIFYSETDPYELIT